MSNSNKRSYSEAIGEEQENEDNTENKLDNKRRKLDNTTERSNESEKIETNANEDKDKTQEETNNTLEYGFNYFSSTAFGFDSYLDKKDKFDDNNATTNKTEDNENSNTKKDEPFTAEWGKKDDTNKDENTLQWDFAWKPTINTDFDFSSVWGQDKKTTDENADDDANENSNENENENENEEYYNFTSQPVAVLKGEELNSGDQQDNVLCSIKAKIFKLEKISPDENDETTNHTNHTHDEKHPSSKYCEKGVGILKVTTYKDDKSSKIHARIICRRNEVHTLILNLPLLKETKFEIKEHYIRITGIQVNDSTDNNNNNNNNNDNNNNNNNDNTTSNSSNHRENISLQTFLIKPLESADISVVVNAIGEAKEKLD